MIKKVDTYTCILRRVTKSNFKGKLSFRKKFKITYRQEQSTHEEARRGWGVEGREMIHPHFQYSSLITTTPSTNSKILHEWFRTLVSPLFLASAITFVVRKIQNTQRNRPASNPAGSVSLLPPDHSLSFLLGAPWFYRHHLISFFALLQV